MKADTYAKAIFDLTGNGKSTDSIVLGLIRSLKFRGALALLPKILSVYEKLSYKDNSKKNTITVAREADIIEALKLSGVEVNDTIVAVDERLIGGYKLEQGGKLLDNSFKAKLLQIYRNSTKA